MTSFFDHDIKDNIKQCAPTLKTKTSGFQLCDLYIHVLTNVMHNVTCVIDRGSGPVSVKVVSSLLKSRGTGIWLWMTAAPKCSHSSWDQPSMTVSIHRPAIQPHDAAAPTSHPNRLSLGSDDRCLLFSTRVFFCSLSPHLSSRSCNAPFALGSVTLVGSRCAGREYTPTSALLSRGGIVAPTGCPWDNWHRTSCYWPLFWCNAHCLRSLSLWKRWLCSLALSVFNLGCVMWLVISILTGCHANGISKAVVPVQWRDGMFALHRQAGRCIQ